MIPDENPSRPEWNFDIFGTEIDVRLYPTHKEIGLGASVLFDHIYSPFEHFIFGIRFHLLLVSFEIDFFKVVEG